MLLSICVIYTQTLFKSIRYPAFGEVIRRQCNRYLVSRQYFYKMHSHLTGNISKYPLPVFKFNPEHCIRQVFKDCTLNLYGFFFRHYRTNDYNYSSQFSQYIKSIFCNSYSMLKMSGQTFVFCNSSPAVIQYDHFPVAGIYHRLYSQRHAG